MKWTTQKCMVALLVDTAEARDVFKPIAIANLALEIIDGCVTHSTGFGGTKAIGPKEMFYVVVGLTHEHYQEID